jgi:Na+-driven multidrug efflux pump
MFNSSEIYKQWWLLTRDGIVGGLIFTILLSTLTVVMIFAGALKDSAVFVTAMGTGAAYIGVIISLAMGCNAGLNAIAARCKGNHDSVTMHYFLTKQVKLMNVFAIIMCIFGVSCWFIFEKLYAQDPILKHWIKIFIVVISATMIVFSYIDMLRNWFLGIGLFLETICLEIVNICFIIGISYT